MKAINPLETTARDLQSALSSGAITSVEIVNVYLAQIERHNDWLRAVLQVAPKHFLLERAGTLDKERQEGLLRGPLHGIPVLDNIDTDPAMGMGTTAGSFALLHAKPRRNAPLVDGLLNGGAIVIGKANLSELAYAKGVGLRCGWSALGGQCQSAYVRGGIDPDDQYGGHSNPGGSSTGSAVGVSAGFAPISIGTETWGSIIMPANRAALYAMKPTIGLVSQEGIIPVCPFCDTAGPMTTSVLDFANTLQAIVDPKMVAKVPKGGYAAAVTGSWDGIRVGALNPEQWRIPSDMCAKDAEFEKQQDTDINAAYKTLKQKGVDIQYPVSLAGADELEAAGLCDLLKGTFAPALDVYLSTLAEAPIKTASGIVEFNNRYPVVELPKPDFANQDYLVECCKMKWSADDSKRTVDRCHHVARSKGFDHTFHKYDVDVIIGPADSTLDMMIAAAGYPFATLPLSYFKKNGRPFGLVAVAPAWQEELLVRVMSAWEATFPRRRVPEL
ncbi:Amidase signature domain [Lasallia pustulata]|uniref:Amidase signature domain n=1 Tax=Lasallia pustulata TaxID=136370 RepID=A0A1W5D105_9LECA|nr:Amidase signature domain [Lasallia pustulata]